ncbi:MAG: hypothetical protein A2017_09635 [Lentisphaerae bacterium GWF2_44_16]|nr:MAG: hypothetical protein A2017_09635 [Lentisphaerae bacterium GWF2_44_16]
MSGSFYINGREVYKRDFVKSDDWKTPFEFEITDELRYGEDNTFAICANGNGLGGIWKSIFLFWK